MNKGLERSDVGLERVHEWMIGVNERVKGVHERVVGVDERVEGVSELDERVKGTNERVVGVDVRVFGPIVGPTVTAPLDSRAPHAVARSRVPSNGHDDTSRTEGVPRSGGRVEATCIYGTPSRGPLEDLGQRLRLRTEQEVNTTILSDRVTTRVRMGWVGDGQGFNF